MIQMKRILAIALIFLFICSLTGCGEDSLGTIDKVTGDIAYFTAMDEATLKETCEGKYIEVSGEVTSSNLLYIRLGDPLSSEVTFNCYLEDGDSIKDIAKGDQITVYGKCTSILLSTITLRNCQIISNNTLPTENSSKTENTTASENTSHIHDYQKATCTDPKTCATCGATEGSAKGHTWKNATCTSPKTCSTCGETSGYAADHSYKNGKCTSCGMSDPDDPSVRMVWIPTKGGKKYHSKASCSNMSNPKKVTQKYAESQGFTPCQKCH